MFKSIKDPSILLWRNKTSLTQITTHLTNSASIKYQNNKLIEDSLSLKIPRQKLPLIESDLLVLVDLVHQQQDNIPNTKNLFRSVMNP